MFRRGRRNYNGKAGWPFFFLIFLKIFFEILGECAFGVYNFFNSSMAEDVLLSIWDTVPHPIECLFMYWC